MAQSFDLIEASVAQIAAALAARAVSSRELVTQYLARIEAYDQRGPALNAISVVNPDAAAEADRLDGERRAGTVRGPLHGIPIVVKDNYETAGMQTAAGSATLAGWIPPDDAALVKRLRAAGAIIVAKANMQEFAYGITTVGSLFGQTRNPYAPDRNPGGSSGGTGAAIAANFAAIGMGSDTCGSIRIPAAHNCLAGIRATQGLLSRAGIVPMSHTQDIGGPMGRGVADLALVLDATAGYDPDDPQTAASVGNIPTSYGAALQPDGLPKGLQGARIGLLTHLFGSEPEDDEVAAIVRAAGDDMRRLGAEIMEITIPGLAELLLDPNAGHLVLIHDVKFDLDAYLASRPTAPVRSLDEALASGRIHPEVEQNLRRSQAVRSRDTKEYWEHVAKRELLRQAVLQAMADHRLDALAYPPIRRQANRIGEHQSGTNCHLSANSGLPALVVPAGFTTDRMPVGVELIGRAWNEALLLRLGYAYEQATKHRRPPASTPPL
jgi:amidase